MYKKHSSNIPHQVASILDHLRDVERLLGQRYGVFLKDLDILDVGVGQFLLQMHYFARNNRAFGIDYDVIAQGSGLHQYLEMLRLNGWRRTAKAVIRKLLGIDRRYLLELEAQLKVQSLPKCTVTRMDVCKMTFPDESFDFVHCHSVFQHLSEPALAIEGIKRVLRQGGVAYASFHLYTSESGSLDPRVFTERRDEVSQWRHLRPQFAGDIVSNAYLNKLRLEQWKELFTDHMPDAAFILNRCHRDGAEADARALLGNGELAGYSLEELLTHRICVLWRKPCAAP